MDMEYRGVIYYGILGEKDIEKWEKNMNFEGKKKKIDKDKNIIKWNERLGLEQKIMNMKVVQNRIKKLLEGRVKIKEKKCRIISE